MLLVDNSYLCLSMYSTKSNYGICHGNPGPTWNSANFTTEFFPYGWDQWSQQHHEDSSEVGYCGHSTVFPIRIEPYSRPNGFVNMPDITV